MSGPNHSAEEMELDREEAALRNEAASIDPVRPEDSQIHDDANPADARAAAREAQPSAKTERTGSDKSPDATAANNPPDTSQDPNKQQQKPSDQKQEPAATKTPEPSPFQKERARLSESWKKLEAEKEALRKEREQIAAERKTATERQSTTQQPAAKPAIDGLDAEGWAMLEADFQAEGNLKLAKAAAANVAKLREQEKAQAAAQQPAQARERLTPEEQEALRTEWQQHLQKLAEENPDLKQEGTPLRSRVAELLKTIPLFHMRGDGIVHAVAMAKLEAKAAQVETMQKRITELETEKKRLESLTALPSGVAAPAANARKFEDMSLDEQERELREQAAA